MQRLVRLLFGPQPLLLPLSFSPNLPRARVQLLHVWQLHAVHVRVQNIAPRCASATPLHSNINAHMHKHSSACDLRQAIFCFVL